MPTPSYTYGGDPTNSPADALRLTLGDTDPSDPLLYDGEVAYFLGKNGGNVAQACYQACGAIIARLSRLCDERVGEVSLSLSQKLKGYLELQTTLERDTGTGAKFFCGGISRSQVRTNRMNPDRVPLPVPERETDPPLSAYRRPGWAGYPYSRD
jgi:hypothetical protein